MSVPEIEDLSDDGGRSVVASPPSHLTRARKMKDEFHIVGRENLVDKLVKQLFDRDDCAKLRVISVVGEEGLGKTALVRSVYNRADVKNHFDRCAWVRVGPDPNLVHLMSDLSKQLRIPELRDVDRMGEDKLADVLQRVLMESLYLTVLDDLWDLHHMDNLMMVLADSRNGSRVIVTTRNSDIPSTIDPWYSTHLQLSPLDREQSKKLMEKCSQPFDVVDPPKELLDLKESIFRKSGGSPPKILLLGGLLSATTLDRCTELANGLPDRPTLQDVVRLIVDEPPDRLKQCALYLTLFPKESEIPTRRLFRLWSAEELLKVPLENGETRVDAEKCFKGLVSRNMVHVARQKWDGSARSCCLPGTLYDVFYQMAKNERFLYIPKKLSDLAKFDALRIAIRRDISGEGEAKAQENAPEVGRERSVTNAHEAHKEITPAKPRQRMSTGDNSMLDSIKQLRSYVSFNTLKLGTRAREIEGLLKPLVQKGDSPVLRVLDLEGVYKPSLPKELGNILQNLKYLGLRWTLIESLPKSVARLSHLETLDLKYTNITQVPVSIWEAKKLLHIYMNEVSFDESIHPQLHSKKFLNRMVQTIWGLHIGVNSPMLKVLSKLTGLRKLGLTCHPSVVRDATGQVLKLNMLESLRLRSKDNFGQPSVLELSDMTSLESLSNLYLLGELQSLSESESHISPELKSHILLESHIPPNLEVLTLSMSGLKVDPMKVLGKAKCLTTLRLFASSYDGETLSVSEGTFPSLRVLKLWNLENLTKWTILANAMPCLADLEIKDCKKLNTIDGLQQIKTLEVIALVRVPDELEQGVRKMRPNVPIIAKELNEYKEKRSNEEDSRRGEKEHDSKEERSNEEDSIRGEMEDDSCEDSDFNADKEIHYSKEKGDDEEPEEENEVRSDEKEGKKIMISPCCLGLCCKK